MTCSLCRERPAKVIAINHTKSGHTTLGYCSECAEDIHRAFGARTTLTPKTKEAR